MINQKSLLRDPFGWLEVLVATASTIATLIVATLSFACAGVAALLSKIPFVTKAYESVLRVYEKLVDRLAQELLTDPRDAPALRLMLTLTLTAVPIFLLQLALGEPNILLAALFYLSLYGFAFHRFVRMFSAKHLEAHRREGFFSEKYSKVFGRYIEFFLGYLYGNVPEMDRTFHVRLHHRENNGPFDTAHSSSFDRTSLIDFHRYLARNLWTTLGVAPYRYFSAKGQEPNRLRLQWGIVRYFAFFGAVFLFDWRIGVLFVLVPFLCMNYITAIIQWVQHAFYDPKNPNDYFGHTVTVLDKVNFMNEGYHLCHHHRAGLHWTEMPAYFEQLRDKMREAGSFVFRDVDFMGLFFELTLFRRFDVLAEKLVTWTPMTHEQKLALIAERTRPLSPA